jgi:RecA-family ATPase
VPSLLVEGQVGVIYAPGGQGKSLFSQDIAIGLACRGRVFGHKVDLRRVLYIDRENSARGLQKRMRAMGLGPGHSALLQDNLHYSLLGSWPAFDSEAGARLLLREVDRLQIDLVVIDTLSKVIQGEENVNDTWNLLHSRSMVGLKSRGVTVLQLDHTGKDTSRGQRGGSAKLDNADVVWFLTADDPHVRLERKKDREGDYASALYLERRKAPVLEHVLVPALPAAATAELKARDRARELAELLDSMDCPIAGRPTVEEWMKEHLPGVSRSKEILGAAIRIRNGRSAA